MSTTQTFGERVVAFGAEHLGMPDDPGATTLLVEWFDAWAEDHLEEAS